MAIRPAAVAGTWYPSHPGHLAEEVEAHLQGTAGAECPDGLTPSRLLALCVPHAGLRYSGPVAAYAYRWLHAANFDTVVLVGPSHYVGFHGVSVWPKGDFETPLGPLQVDEAMCAALLDATSVVHVRREAHAREHSLEMQLPFLAHLTPEARIVPLVMGFQTRDTAFALGDAITHAARDRRVLLVASSDLSHFYDAREAVRLDAQVTACIDRFDPSGLMNLLEQQPVHACGGGPLVSVLHAARLLGGVRARTLHYADSGDVSGDKSSVVGYLAAAIWR